MLKINEVYESYNGYYIYLGVEETDFYKMKLYRSLLDDCEMIFNTGVTITGAKDLLKKVVQQDMSTFAFLYIAPSNQPLNQVLMQPLQGIDNMQIVYSTYADITNWKAVYTDTDKVQKWLMKNCMINEDFNQLYNSKVFLSYKEALNKYMHQLDTAWPDLFDFYYRLKENKYVEKSVNRFSVYHLYCYYVNGSKCFALGLPDNELLIIGQFTGKSLKAFFTGSIVNNPVDYPVLFDTGVKCRFLKTFEANKNV